MNLVALEDFLPRHSTLDVYGIILDRKLGRARYIAGKPLRRRRLFPNLYYFEKVTIDELDPWKDKILFLAENVYIGSTPLPYYKQLCLLGAEFTGQPTRIKRRYKRWRIYSGIFKFKHREFKVELLVRTSTHSKRHVLFIVDAGDGVMYAKSMLFNKRRLAYMKPVKVIEVYVQPLFHKTIQYLTTSTWRNDTR